MKFFMPDGTLTDAGIVVEASRDLIRKGAEKVLTDFTMHVEDSKRKKHTMKESLDIGDSLIFKENIGFCPALVIATKLENNLWFIMTSSECPKTKCDDRQAMKCARLNDQNVRILRDFVAPRKEARIVSKWRSEISDPIKMESIIDRTTQRWTH